ncbi:hypothetical protein P152DRAFT_514162, partial [Eremomyces bilateralis CBS 781.70]
MSTFNGIVEEFPYIRIDNFRKWPDASPPLACFLSHVHSDHLLGLESLKAPFIYCSPATREILLRLEKYPHRLNFAKGILEQRLQSYGHLKKLLKPIPLDTSCVLQLTPQIWIRVTLFDANHCIGAVGFLIEGLGQDAGKTILYSGDVRAERWWVDSLARKPYMIPYISPSFGRPTNDRHSDRKIMDDAADPENGAAVYRPNILSTLYLDTTFATTSLPFYREFPSKASGISELLRKCAEFPPKTIFYLRAWTFGYEDVFQALSTALNSRIHLDKYRYNLYTSVSKASIATNEAPCLAGYRLGNHEVEGCLTRTTDGVRIHACEIGMDSCAIRKKLDSGEVVGIVPIISRIDEGSEILEVGAGGGIGDLDQEAEGNLEVELDAGSLDKLRQLLSEKLKNESKRLKVFALLEQSLEKLPDGRAKLDLARIFQESTTQIELDRLVLDGMPLKHLVEIIPRSVEAGLEGVTKVGDAIKKGQNISTGGNGEQSRKRRTISFPYSRHSSLSELQYFVSAFRPEEVYPCTVELAAWTEDVCIDALFGHLCDDDGAEFRADAEMRARIKEKEEYRIDKSRKRQRLRETSQERHQSSSPVLENEREGQGIIQASRGDRNPENAGVAERSGCQWRSEISVAVAKGEFIPISDDEEQESSGRTITRQQKEPTPPQLRTTRQWAYEAALGRDGLAWEDMGELACTRKRKPDESQLD